MPTHATRLQTALAEGRSQFERGDFADSRRAFATVVASAPASAEAHARLAEACVKLGDWPAAAHSWRRLLELRPGLAVAHTGLALALRELGESAAATAEFQRAAEANPAMPEMHFNLGNDHLGCGRPSAAVSAFRAALKIDPGHCDARFNLALALLKSGSFKTGALAYDARWQSEWRGKERPFAGPRWAGRALPTGAPLLLWGEQGIGDEIMFAGLIPEALRSVQTPVWVECAPRLVPLFERSFPSLRVFGRTNPPASALQGECTHAPLGALPGLLWPAGRAPEAPPAFLRAAPDVVARMRDRLTSLGPGRKLGIAWRGGHTAAQHPRLIPPPAWAPLLHAPDVVPICLQHATDPQELAAITAVTGRPIHQIADIDPMTDMDGFAALITALDAVITVDNSTAHLAGALGVPACVLLGFESDWRWGIDGVPCPWYRSVMRIRQQVAGDWSTPMESALDFLALSPARR